MQSSRGEHGPRARERAKGQARLSEKAEDRLQALNVHTQIDDKQHTSKWLVDCGFE